jgi:hypothetical protein
MSSFGQGFAELAAGNATNWQYMWNEVSAASLSDLSLVRV